MSVDIFTKNPYPTDVVLTRSRRWLYYRLAELQNVNRKAIVSHGKLQKTVGPGNVVFYFYQAKYADKLPFWDAFPLVCILEEAPGGFYGINLHYVSIEMRQKIFQMLRRYADRKLTKRSRMHYTWQALMGWHQILSPMTKRYRYDCMRSPFRKIEPDDWGYAMMLKTEQFQKVTSARAQRLTAIAQKGG